MGSTKLCRGNRDKILNISLFSLNVRFYKAMSYHIFFWIWRSIFEQILYCIYYQLTKFLSWDLECGHPQQLSLCASFCLLAIESLNRVTELKVSVFGVILVRIFPNSDCIRSSVLQENTDQNNSEYRLFLRSE